MSVEILKATAVHPAVILRLFVGRSSKIECLIREIVYSCSAVKRKGCQHFGSFGRVGDLFFDERLEETLHKEHGEDVLTDDHARCIFVRELRIEREPQSGKKVDGAIEVFDRQINEDLLGDGHGSTLPSPHRLQRYSK